MHHWRAVVVDIHRHDVNVVPWQVSPVSVGVSKSGAFLNVSTPLDEISNLPASAPDNDHENTVPASTSVAAYSWTAVEFSGLDKVVGGDVSAGFSFTFVRLMVTVISSSTAVLLPPAASLPSCTVTMTV